MNATSVEVVQNAYGYVLTFDLQNPDGTPFDLTANTAIKLNVQFANTSGIKFTAVLSATVTPTDGKAQYTVGQSDFSEAGTYNAQIEVDLPSGVQIWPNITIRAYKQLPNF